ncbi:MAG TPA: hypothetical protein VL461_08800 [Dictyobacter sp.]|nr:hypothetical protein [Dictyobacter sp.]
MDTLLLRFRRCYTFTDILCLFLPVCAAAFWLIPLSTIDIGRMNALGLVSVLPPLMLFALLILTVSFCLLLTQPTLRVSYLLLHLLLLIGMLYGITALVESVPRFSVVYRHAGFTEYIMRTGTVDPGLDAYFNWPGFFILSALVTQLAGYYDILGYAAWAPLFFNLCYLAPLYVIFTTATEDRRIVWLGLWFFYSNNWVGQDYFSPQGLATFLFLMVIAILLKYFTVASHTRPVRWQQSPGIIAALRNLVTWAMWVEDTVMPCTSISRSQRIGLLVVLLVLFFFIVFSHPLTSVFVLAGVIALVLCRRCASWYLPVMMVLIDAVWIYAMTRTYLAGHFALTMHDSGVRQAVTSNVSSHVVGNAFHTFIVQMRLGMTLLVWSLAGIGFLRRWRSGYRDVTFLLLICAPLPLLLAQSYGGEMVLRLYLITLPMMAFFGASLFFVRPTARTSPWVTIGLLGISLLFLTGFVFTRYGNEQMDAMTSTEVTGVQYLYNVARPGSMLIAGWSGTPWRFRADEQYDTYTLNEQLPAVVAQTNVDELIHFIESTAISRSNTGAYLLFTRSQRITIADTTNLPAGILARLERALLASGKFKLLYQSSDAQIFVFTGHQ